MLASGGGTGAWVPTRASDDLQLEGEATLVDETRPKK